MGDPPPAGQLHCICRGVGGFDDSLRLLRYVRLITTSPPQVQQHSNVQECRHTVFFCTAIITESIETSPRLHGHAGQSLPDQATINTCQLHNVRPCCPGTHKIIYVSSIIPRRLSMYTLHGQVTMGANLMQMVLDLNIHIYHLPRFCHFP